MTSSATLLLLASSFPMEAPAAPPVLLTQSELNSISRHCRTPRRWIARHGDSIDLRLGPKATYEQVMCLLDELKRLNAGPLGFVGNETRP